MIKKLLMPALFISLVLLALFFSCRKLQQPDSSANIKPYSLKTGSCQLPDYGDSILFPKWKGPHNDYKVSPKNNKLTGTWFAWPEGLVIDRNTGEINVSASETGIRYKIGFTETGSRDTCVSTLILGGITYVDSIYSMEKNDTLAYPFYYANPAAPAICDPSDDTDYPHANGGGPHGNNKCEFDDDEDDDLNNGPADEPPPGAGANKQGVRVRTISGIINLKRTMSNIFGNNPQNGATKDVDIYYRLNDRSGKALQKISVRFIYYNTAAGIPIYLKHEIRAKRKNFLNYMVADSKPRPPMIILTRYSE